MPFDGAEVNVIHRGKAASLRYVELLTGSSATPMRVRMIFDDESVPKAERPPARMLGLASLEAHAAQMLALQQEGYGAFLVVNEGGEEDAEIAGIRALYVDFDNKPLPDTFHAAPDFIVRRDDLHHHVFWLVAPGVPVAAFKGLQRRLIAYYGSDRSITNPSRVMRIPGFKHLKQRATPRNLTLTDFHAGTDAWDIPRRSVEEIIAGLPVVPETALSPACAVDQADDPYPMTLAQKRRALGFIDPNQFKGDRAGYFGIMRNIIDGQGLTDDEGADLDVAAVEWASRSKLFLDAESCLHDVRAERRTSGTITTNATILHLANEGGFRERIADPTKRFDGYTAPQIERERAEAGPFVDLWEEFPLPRFPLDTLPPTLRAFVEFTTRSLGTDPSAVALAVLVACSGAIDHRVRLQMERNNAEWQAIPNLWALNVGDPASEKSPIGRRVLKPLEKAEARLWTPYQNDRHHWENAKASGAEALKALYPEGAPKPPPQYLFNRTTEEALLEALERQPRGALVYADEWAGWLGGMSKFGGKGAGQDNRAVWLSLRDGGSAKTNRKTVASIRADNASVSLLGNTQPDRLAELGSLESDGLLQRHLVCMMSPGGEKEDLDDGGAIFSYETVIETLLKVNAAQMRMSDGAYIEARRLRKFLDDLRRMPGLMRGFVGFIGKLPGIHGNLMIVLHLAAGRSAGEPVSEWTAVAASRIIEGFALWHAEALYDVLENGAKNREQLRALGAFVLCSSKDRFTLRDFTQQHKFLRDLNHREQVEWVGRLLGIGYLTVENNDFVPKAWLAVPEARLALKGRIADLRVRNAEVAAKMQALRTTRPG